MNSSRAKHKKAAIELSANFIVVMVISIVILVGSLALFFKLHSGAQQYVDTLDQQTQAELKSVMLSNNYRVAVYPTDVSISNGGASLIGLGINNVYTNTETFQINISNIMYFSSPTSSPKKVTDVSAYGVPFLSTIKISPQAQSTKGILLKIPKSASNGEYVYTITVDNSTFGQYGVVQAYVTNQ